MSAIRCRPMGGPLGFAPSASSGFLRDGRGVRRYMSLARTLGGAGSFPDGAKYFSYLLRWAQVEGQGGALVGSNSCWMREFPLAGMKVGRWPAVCLVLANPDEPRSAQPTKRADRFGDFQRTRVKDGREPISHGNC